MEIAYSVRMRSGSKVAKAKLKLTSVVMKMRRFRTSEPKLLRAMRDRFMCAMAMAQIDMDVAIVGWVQVVRVPGISSWTLRVSLKRQAVTAVFPASSLRRVSTRQSNFFLMTLFLFHTDRHPNQPTNVALKPSNMLLL